MKARIVPIGDGNGIQVPSALFEQSGLGEEVELEVHHHRIIIRAPAPPRAGWEMAFQEMAGHGDDALLDPEVSIPSVWDEEEREW